MGSLEQKKQVVESIKDKFTKAQSVVMMEYRGLNVGEITELRSKMKKAGNEMKVFKNTLVERAADDCGIMGLNKYLNGPIAWGFSLQDPISAPKVVSEFAKTHKKLIIKGGILEKKAIEEDGVRALAELPSREVLLAQVLAGMQAPLTGMANVLQGPIRKFVYAIEALRKEKEQV
ncbi:MAG: 50S ribosomal protein L10 [Clostridia bacterium]|nr:50S ribosomal protein L10 [Clostridia bacterium]MDD4047339.1 50S ribosomal protein L10 [Clostridia bacterium]